jgi:hypothetical protein
MASMEGLCECLFGRKEKVDEEELESSTGVESSPVLGSMPVPGGPAVFQFTVPDNVSPVKLIQEIELCE